MRTTTRFLLVEDDRNDAALVTEVFRRGNHCQLDTVRDGQEAMDYLLAQGTFKFREGEPMPHVILLDLKMPRVDGFEFLRWLRHDAPRNLRLVPVVVMSSSDHPNDVRRAYELGVNSYLLKPIQWTEFQARMEALNIFWTQHVETPSAPG
jgi:two-component system response regulator